MSVRMVDISEKEDVYREAVAEGVIELREETIERIKAREVEKGDVLTVAKIAAIMAVKNTPSIIPLCHNIPITHVDIRFEFISSREIKAIVKVRTVAKTGVEMEALTGVCAALLTIWDMVKKYEKDQEGQYPYTKIKSVKVVSKVKR